MSQTLVASLGFAAGVVAVLVDGSRLVWIAALATGLGLAPAAASVGGGDAALVPVVAGVLAPAGAGSARRLALSLPRTLGMNPAIPVVAPRQALFGPRSVRAVGGAVALVAASWVGLNVPVGNVAAAQGAVFAAAYVWICGVVRLLRARAVDDLAAGAATVAMAAAVGWILEAGPGAVPVAAAVAAFAPLTATGTGWLLGRHRSAATAPPP